MDTADNKSEIEKITAIDKIQWLAVVAGDWRLSRAELAICCNIANRANEQGIAWPSFNRIAEDVGVSRRAVALAMKSILSRGIVRQHQKGSSVKSTRYSLNLAYEIPQGRRKPRRKLKLESAQGGELQCTTELQCGGELQCTSESQCTSELQCADVVHCNAPGWGIAMHSNPSINRLREPIEGGMIANAEPAPAVPPRGGRSLGTGGGEGRFAEFWEAVGRRVTVGESNELLAKLVDGGEDYSAIVDGARRWAKYNQATNAKRLATPLKWLQRGKWQDGWQVPDRKPKAKPAKFKSYEAFRDVFQAQANIACELDEALLEHAGAGTFRPDEPAFDDYCDQCREAFLTHGRAGCFDHLCSEGQELMVASNKAEKALDAIEEQAPPDWVERYNDE